MMEDTIKAASAQFEKLLREQLARQERMEKGAFTRDFAKAERIVIGVIGGDGIGPIIMREAVRALEKLLADELASGRVVMKEIGGLTLENRLALGQAVPDAVLAEIKSCDVLLKGPTETPRGGTLESANVTLRRELDLYANVRPVCVPEEGIDWIFFRENTEGSYAVGSKGLKVDDDLSIDFCVTTTQGTDRIIELAFDYAVKTGRTRVDCVTKANIIKATDGKFLDRFNAIAARYPDIEHDSWFVDIRSAKLIDEKRRRDFSVIVLPNLYGDILTDEAAQIQGGVGTAGSANTGDHYAMFEAIHGSAPRMIARGMGDYANPESILRAAVMLLRHIGMPEKADKLDAAITATAINAPITGTKEGNTCQGFGDALVKALQ